MASVNYVSKVYIAFANCPLSLFGILSFHNIYVLIITTLHSKLYSLSFPTKFGWQPAFDLFFVRFSSQSFICSYLPENSPNIRAVFTRFSSSCSHFAETLNFNYRMFCIGYSNSVAIDFRSFIGPEMRRIFENRTKNRPKTGCQPHFVEKLCEKKIICVADYSSMPKLDRW